MFQLRKRESKEFCSKRTVAIRSQSKAAEMEYWQTAVPALKLHGRAVITGGLQSQPPPSTGELWSAVDCSPSPHPPRESSGHQWTTVPAPKLHGRAVVTIKHSLSSCWVVPLPFLQLAPRSLFRTRYKTAR